MATSQPAAAIPQPRALAPRRQRARRKKTARSHSVSVIAKVLGATAGSPASMQLRWLGTAQLPAWPTWPHRMTDERQPLECDASSQRGLTAIAPAGSLSKRMHQRRDGTSRRGLSFDFAERPALPETVRQSQSIRPRRMGSLRRAFLVGNRAWRALHLTVTNHHQCKSGVHDL